MTPQLYDNTVLVSTVPGNAASFYKGNGRRHRLGARRRHRQARSGSSTRSPTAPSCGATRRSTAAAASGTRPPSTARGASSSPSPTRRRCTARKKFPNGSSRPGPNLYTNSLVALDGQTGKRLWFRQAVRHDVRDYDLHDPRDPHDRSRSTASRPRSCSSPARWARPSPTAPTDGKHLWTRLRRQAPERHRAAAAQARSRSSPATSAASRRRWRSPPTVSSCPGSTFPPARAQAASPGGFAGSSHDFKQGPRRPHRSRRRHRQGALAAQAAVDGLRRGHGRQRRRLHQRPTRARSTPSTPRPARRSGRRRRPPASTRSPPSTATRCSSAPARPGSTRTRSSSSSPTRSRSDPIPRRFPNEKTHHPLDRRARGGRDRVARARPAAPRHAPRRRRTRARPRSQVTGKEFSFKLSTKSIAKPGKVTFSFKNVGHMVHDFTINGKKTPLIQPGKTAKLAVTFKKKGKYRYLCTVPGHAAAGMKGVFTVR